MTEKEALRQMELICQMMILCMEVGQPEKAEQRAEDLHQAYRDWFDAWRGNQFNEHR